MWLYTIHGFYSVVAVRPNPEGNAAQVPGGNLIMVRARKRQHLMNLQNRFPGLLAPYRISETPTNDYKCRMVLPGALWIEIAKELAAEITYPNFKEIVKASPETDPSYGTVLHDVWEVMFWWQCQGARGSDGKDGAEDVLF